jgi:hypothetical protein
VRHNRLPYRINDPGLAVRATDAPVLKQGGLFVDDGGQNTFTDGSGNKFWFIDTSAGNVTVTLPDATSVTADTRFIVKRTTGGTNTLTVTPGSGTVDGFTSYLLASKNDVATFVSDGSNYWTI